MQANVLVLGATSDIAKALMHAYASKGHGIILAGRNLTELKAEAADLQIRFEIPIQVLQFEATDLQSHYTFFDQINPDLSAIVCVFGFLGKEDDWEKSGVASEIMKVNYIGAVSILEEATRWCKQHQIKPMIIGISSVAGDRGRASNYLYGSAKAGFSTYLSGLRNRLYHEGMHVMTVKPGYTLTRMTEGMRLPALLTAKPAELAKAILTAQKRKKNVIYYRPIWRWIMLIIQLIPEFLFKRLRL